MEPKKRNVSSSSSSSPHRPSTGRWHRITPAGVESTKGPQVPFHETTSDQFEREPMQSPFDGTSNDLRVRQPMAPPYQDSRGRETWDSNDEDDGDSDEKQKCVLEQKWVERQRQNRRSSHQRRSSSVKSAMLPPLREVEEEVSCSSSRGAPLRQSMPSLATSSSPKRIQLSEMEEEKLKTKMAYSNEDREARLQAKNGFFVGAFSKRPQQQQSQHDKEGSRRHSSHLPHPGATFVSNARQPPSDKGNHNGRRSSAPESAVAASIHQPHASADRSNYSPKRIRMSDMEEEKRKAQWTPQQGAPGHRRVVPVAPNSLERAKAELQRAEREMRAAEEVDEENDEQYPHRSSSSHSPSSAAARRARVRLSDMEQEKRRAANPERESFLSQGGDNKDPVRENHSPFWKFDQGGAAFWHEGKPRGEGGIIVGGVNRMEGSTPLYSDDEATEYTTTPRWSPGNSSPSVSNTQETTVNAFLKEDMIDGTVVVDAINVDDIKKDPTATISSRRFCIVVAVTVLLAITVGGVAGYWSSTSSELVLRSTVPTIAPTTPFPTAAPTRKRLDFLEQVQAISSWEDLHTSGTPAQRALKWILEEDEARRTPDDPRMLQRYVLAVFFFATNGETWPCQARRSTKLLGCEAEGRLSPRFLIRQDECEWHGITCHEDNVPPKMVTEIRMHGRSERILLSGTLPSELGGLSELRLLSLPNNLFEGTIPPELITGTKNSLGTLALPNSTLSGPIPHEAFANHTKIDTIVWSNNTGIGGTIPSFLSSLKQLRVFQASRCSMEGTLPASLGHLSELGTLELRDNDLTGTIPPEWSQLPKLAILKLEHNRISGSIPKSIFSASWPSLSFFGLSHNLLTGTLPDSPLAFAHWGSASMKRRKEVMLNDNKFHGLIPSALSSIHYLTKLTLQGNNFTGNVSSQICGLRDNKDVFWKLHYLAADCLDDRLGSSNYVSCSCCTNCF